MDAPSRLASARLTILFRSRRLTAPARTDHRERIQMLLVYARRKEDDWNRRLWTMSATPDDLRHTAGELARQYAAQRRRITSTCAVCGKSIEGVVTRTYCGQSCRTTAYRRRRRGQPVASATRTVAGASAGERLARVRETIMRGRVFDDDSTELLRRAREDRTTALTHAAAGPSS
jgi:hypothetical protein